MKKKFYDYENFSKCKELPNEFKNGKIFKIIFENHQYSPIFSCEDSYIL